MVDSLIIKAALEEDLGRGDATTDALIPANLTGRAVILVKADGVIAGMKVAKAVFYKVDPGISFEVSIKDGRKVKPGDVAARLAGNVASILKAERVALNFLTHLSGIATVTAEFVSRAAGGSAVIKDTRKTIPGLRHLQKEAVLAGGGKNHRIDLSEAILIKDNHLAAMRGLGLSLTEIVSKARKNAPPGLKIECEVTSLEEAKEAAAAGADAILLDNMTPAEMRRVTAAVPEELEKEASGGVNLENVAEIAATGVNVISVGALTHSVKNLDISLEIEPESLKLV